MEKPTQHAFLHVPEAVRMAGLIHHSIHLLSHSSFTLEISLATAVCQRLCGEGGLGE